MRMLNQGFICLLLTSVIYTIYGLPQELSDGEKISTHIPKILTAPKSIYVDQGETVTLECDIDQLDPYTLFWNKGKKILFLGEQSMSQDSRFTLQNTNLVIAKFNKDDEGDYSCSISTSPKPTVLMHKVSIKTVAKIMQADPAPGDIEILEGSPLSLTCKADGKPHPVIKWTNEDYELRSTITAKKINDGHTLQFKSIQQSDAGQYECAADNKVGQGDRIVYRIKVLSKPKVTIEQSLTPGGGTTVNLALICKVKAEPAAAISWKRSGKLINPENSDRYEIKPGGAHHSTLSITNLQEKDFGPYECLAENNLGRAEAVYKVTASLQDETNKVTSTTESVKEVTSGLTNETSGASSSDLHSRARMVAIMTVVILVAFF